jgi:uncharacterized protein (DUF433 family)
VTATRFERITVDPQVMGGRPCIRGFRFLVSRLLGLPASGERPESLVEEYPSVEPGDIQAAFAFSRLDATRPDSD